MNLEGTGTGKQYASLLMLTYLVPFFFVRSLNVIPWINGQRQFENNVNGVIAQGLLCMAVLNGLWFLVAMPLGADFPSSPRVPVILYLSLAILHLAWLNGHRAKAYQAAFERLPSGTQTACTLGSAVLFGAGLLSLFLSVPLRA